MGLIQLRHLSAEEFDGGWRLDDEPLEVDLSSTGFIRPAGAVRLCCAIAQHQQAVEAEGVVFSRPRSSDVARYASRLGIAEFLDNRGVAHDLPTVRKHEVDTMADLREFDNDEENAYAVSDLLFGLAEDSGFPAESCDTLYDCLHEVVDNCVTHSHASTGVAAAQVFGRGTDRRVEFAIGDCGIGVRASLAPAFAPETHLAAIALAIADRTSSVHDHRGIGLHNLVKWVTRAGGNVRLRSGDAQINLIGRERLEPTSQVGLPYLQGTIVSASLPC